MESVSLVSGLDVGLATTKKSEELFSEALRWMPGGVSSPVRAFRAVGGSPFFVKNAKGARLVTVDGVELIDYVCGWGPHILGHADERVVRAVREAAQRGLSFGVNQPGEVDLARSIVSGLPGAEKVRFCNSGTEAVATAIRLARGATGRDVIVKFAGCFHGHVDALLVSGGSGQLTLGRPDSAGVPRDVATLTRVLPFNDTDAVRNVFLQEREKIACVIVEPVPANAGLYLPEPGFLELLRQLCSESGSLLIFDEVMTGFRLARGGAAEIFGVQPDLFVLGKVIGGGLPIGAVCGPARWMDLLAPDGPVYHAGTLAGNPMVTAAGVAQLDALEYENAWIRLESLGSQLAEGLRSAMRKTRVCAQVQQIGSMICVYFTDKKVRNVDDALRCDRQSFATFFRGMLKRGVYIPPSQFECWFLSLAHGEGEIEKTIESARFVFEAMN
jgi:glutamate-1-semialdehyde 2,1-aminomutase